MSTVDLFPIDSSIFNVLHGAHTSEPGPCLNIKTVFPGMGIPL